MLNLNKTHSYCSDCARVIPAEVIEKAGHLFLSSDCPTCGPRNALVEHDAALYQQWEKERRPNRPAPRFQTSEKRGCPFDCGLCPNHHQKSCIALLEITDACDLGCPVCYADSTGSGNFKSLATIERMLDAAVDSANGQPEILQISGGEPTCHPQILEILRAAKARPFKYVMLNTNGLSIANGTLPLDALSPLGNGFEIFLQFDGLDNQTHLAMRGRPLLKEKQAALDLLAEHQIPVTLVATLRRGLNLEQAGDLLRYALNHPAVRGINFQCEAFFGRTPASDETRVTQTEIVNILSQTASEMLNKHEFIPLSCGLASMVYLEKIQTAWKPVPRILADIWKGNPMTGSIEELFEAASNTCICQGGLLAELAKRLPADLLTQSVQARSRLVHERFFHLTVTSFLDGGNFDLNRASRECTHILQEDGTKIPFSAYNTIYRGRHV